MGRTSKKGWSSECNNITAFEVALFVVKPFKSFLTNIRLYCAILLEPSGHVCWTCHQLAKIKVSMLLLISFDGWNVGMVLGSLTPDITLFIWIFVCQIALAMIWYDDARCCIDMMIRYYDSWRSLQYWMQHTWDTEILQSNGPTIESYKWKALQRRASNNSCWGS